MSSPEKPLNQNKIQNLLFKKGESILQDETLLESPVEVRRTGAKEYTKNTAYVVGATIMLGGLAIAAERGLDKVEDYQESNPRPTVDQPMEGIFEDSRPANFAPQPSPTDINLPK